MKIRKNIVGLLIMVIVALSFENVKAQRYVTDNGYPVLNSIGIGFWVGIGQYRGDYHSFTRALEDLDYKFAFGMNIKYDVNNTYVDGSFSRIFDKRLSFTLGIKKMTASSNKNDYGEVMNMDILEFSTTIQMNILKYETTKKLNYGGELFTPYIEGGFGFVGTNCNNSKDISLKTVVHFADDKYVWSPIAIVGLGFKLNIFRGMTLILNGSYHFSFKDDLDHVSTITERNDQYYYAGVEISFNIGELFSR